MAVKPYDFKNVNLILTDSTGQQHYMTGFASGSTIDAERKSDKYTPHVGAKGDTTYAKNNDNSGTIKFKLKIDSPSNAVLNTLSQGDTTFDTQIVDANDQTKSQVSATDCIIMKPATYTRGSEISDSEWTIGCPAIDIQY